MPTYQFECEKCANVHTVVMKMTEYDAYPKVCSATVEPVEGVSFPCGGSLIQDYSNRESQNFILQGSGWTPKFGPVNARDTRVRRG